MQVLTTFFCNSTVLNSEWMPRSVFSLLSPFCRGDAPWMQCHLQPQPVLENLQFPSNTHFVFGILHLSLEQCTSHDITYFANCWVIPIQCFNGRFCHFWVILFLSEIFLSENPPLSLSALPGINYLFQAKLWCITQSVCINSPARFNLHQFCSIFVFQYLQCLVLIKLSCIVCVFLLLRPLYVLCYVTYLSSHIHHCSLTTTPFSRYCTYLSVTFLFI